MADGLELCRVKKLDVLHKAKIRRSNEGDMLLDIRLRHREVSPNMSIFWALFIDRDDYPHCENHSMMCNMGKGVGELFFSNPGYSFLQRAHSQVEY